MKRHPVNICGLRYDLRILKKCDDGLDDKPGDEPAWGDTDYMGTHMTLYQSDAMSAERKLEVFLHECVHALMYETTAAACLKANMEEVFVCRMAAPLAAFIRDNRALLDRMGAR